MTCLIIYFSNEPISKVLAFFVNFTFDRAVEPFYGIAFGFFAKKAWKIKFLSVHLHSRLWRELISFFVFFERNIL